MKKIPYIIILIFFALHALAKVETVESVDLNKYLGKWYEVASIPQWFQKNCISNTTAEYSTDEDNLVKVYNSCDNSKGERELAEGRARVEDTKTNSKLKVTFVKFFDWIFAFGGNYWIVDLAPDYSLSLVGDPTAKYAWILSRSPSIPKETLIGAEKKFKSMGYDTCQILTSIQSQGLQERKPLCEYVK